MGSNTLRLKNIRNSELSSRNRPDPTDHFKPGPLLLSEYPNPIFLYVRNSYVFRTLPIDIFSIFTYYIFKCQIDDPEIFLMILRYIQIEIIHLIGHDRDSILQRISLVDCYNVLEATEFLSNDVNKENYNILSQEQLCEAIINNDDSILNSNFLYSFYVNNAQFASENVAIILECYPRYNADLTYPNDRHINIIIWLTITDEIKKKFNPDGCVVFAKCKQRESVKGTPVFDAIPVSICSNLR